MEELIDEFQAYCEEHNLPSMSADELSCEIWAVLSDEKSAFVEPATTDERREELRKCQTWLGEFIERWDRQQGLVDRLAALIEQRAVTVQ